MISPPMRTLIALTLVTLAVLPARAAAPPYRFASSYTITQLLADPARVAQFVDELVRWEAEYFAIARHPESGLSYDGFELDPGSGQAVQVRSWSAPSKECLDIAVLVRALRADPIAARLVSPNGSMIQINQVPVAGTFTIK